MSIPKEKIEEVRERASIIQVISEYVPLNKRGHNHIGLCPFHSEKTPSFTVSEEKKIFYCFGCNATGNVITFLMKKEGIDFPDAVRTLAKRYGITINESRRAEPDPRDEIYQALREASAYFSTELRGPLGKPAIAYLKNRGFDGETALKFKVGFAPEKWEGLLAFLKKKGISADTAEKAGLAVKREKSTGHYDRFRGRVIFPIEDAKGRIIGFGGRSLDDKNQPKYLNSPESIVFKKGETLYGLPQAKESIRKEDSVIVVEGYFDLLALHRHGFTNSVATMGTALTPEHVRALKAYAATIYCLFDSDEAGKNAAIRGLNLFLNEEMPCRAVILSQGKDPDEFLRLCGPEAMREAVKSAPTLMEFYLKSLDKKFNVSAPEGKSKYFDNAMSYLTRIRNIAERGHYASIVASTLGIGLESVYEALKVPVKGQRGGGIKIKGVIDSKGSRYELMILRVLVKHPELYTGEEDAAIEAFSDPELKSIGLLVAVCLREGRVFNAQTLMEEAGSEGLRGKVAELFFGGEDGFIEEPGRMLQDSLKRLLNRGKIKATTQEMIKLLEQTGKSEIAVEIKRRIELGTSGKRH